MDVHNCLNRIIQAINPATASRRPAALYQICRFAVGEVAVGRYFHKIYIITIFQVLSSNLTWRLCQGIAILQYFCKGLVINVTLSAPWNHQVRTFTTAYLPRPVPPANAEYFMYIIEFDWRRENWIGCLFSTWGHTNFKHLWTLITYIFFVFRTL